MSKDNKDLQESVRTERKQRGELQTNRDRLEERSTYLTRRTSYQQTNNDILTKEKNELTLSLSQLQDSHAALSNEVTELKVNLAQLQSFHSAGTVDKALLQKQYDAVLKRKNELHASHELATKDRDRLQIQFRNVSRSKDELQTSYIKLVKEAEHLEERYNLSSFEKDKLEGSHSNLVDEVIRIIDANYILKKQEQTLSQKFDTARSNFSEEDCNNHTVERERLQTTYEDLRDERDQLQAEVERLKATMNDKRCLTGWRKFEHSCYFPSSVKKNWAKAREYCQTRGAELAIITSTEEMTFINSLYSSDQEVWIGLTDEGQEDQWKWVDGTSMTLAFWGKGQPNSHNGKNQDCVEVWHRTTGTGDWNDESCTIAQKFICEI
ncbi:C-type lectin domain family 10 member A-like isoform X2 [Cheilinus undulatus]|nr:C-type lectin domain family 10 member A-like isoform X2 [Cheilinus undulatus]